MIKHVTCQPGDAAFESFLEMPASIYDAGQLRSTDIPRQHLLDCIVVYKDSSPVARVALYDNPVLRYEDHHMLLAGGFESINDKDTARHLFSIVSEYARQCNRRFVVGPMNGSTWEEYRLPLSFDRRLFFTETLYPPYYADLWKAAGFEILHRYYSSISDVEPAASVTCPSLTIRNINLNGLTDELSSIYELCMKAFIENAFFSPIERLEFVGKYQAIRQFIDPDLVLIAADKESGETKAVVFCLPDIFDPGKCTAIIKTIVKDPAAPKGLVTEMLSILYSNAYRKGYKQMIHAFMHETNRSNKLSQLFGGKVFREYALFIKPVN